MFIHSTVSRLTLVAVVLLSLVILVNASPIALLVFNEDVVSLEKVNQNCYGEYSYGGLDIVTLLLQLQQEIEFKLALLGEFNSFAYQASFLRLLI